MNEVLTLALVFFAVSIATWCLAPLITQAGTFKAEVAAGKRDAPRTPLHHFTTPERLAASCWTAAVFSGGLTGAALLAAGVLNQYILLLSCLVMGALGFQVPRVRVNRKIRARQLAFEARLMDVTLGLANGLRAGAALPQSIEMLTRQMTGPVHEEFSLLLREYQLGVDLPDALERLSKRMPGEDLFLLTTAVRLTMQSGGSLAEVLERISGTIRGRTEFQQKLRTMTAQGRMEAIAMASAPLAAFLIILLVDRQLMMPLVTTPIGWTAIGIVLVLETIGFLIINKIVTIKV